VLIIRENSHYGSDVKRFTMFKAYYGRSKVYRTQSNLTPISQSIKASGMHHLLPETFGNNLRL